MVSSFSRWTSCGMAVLVLICALLCMPKCQEAQSSARLAISHVTLIDATGAPPKPDMTLVIRGDRIVQVTPSSKMVLPAQTMQIDGRGKFVIPGLWDMHTHVLEFSEIWLPVLIAHGVTGIRNMHNVSLETGIKLRTDVETGKVLGPHIVLSGPLVDGPTAVWPFAIKVSTAAEGRTAVRTLKNGGADFIKVYSFLPREAYFAIADEARHQQTPFAGHVPKEITVEEASQEGQKSIEHLDRELLSSASQ